MLQQSFQLGCPRFHVCAWGGRKEEIKLGGIRGCCAAKKMSKKEVTEMSGHMLKRSPGTTDSCIISEKK